MTPRAPTLKSVTVSNSHKTFCEFSFVMLQSGLNNDQISRPKCLLLDTYLPDSRKLQERNTRTT